MAQNLLTVLNLTQSSSQSPCFNPQGSETCLTCPLTSSANLVPPVSSPGGKRSLLPVPSRWGRLLPQAFASALSEYSPRSTDAPGQFSPPPGPHSNIHIPSLPCVSCSVFPLHSFNTRYHSSSSISPRLERELQEDTGHRLLSLLSPAVLPGMGEAISQRLLT